MEREREYLNGPDGSGDRRAERTEAAARVPTNEQCQWTNCAEQADGKRTDGHTTKLLCQRHLNLTSRRPH